MTEIGPIVRLQVQTASLKVGEAPRRHYDPSPLLSMSALAIDADGAIGLIPGGDPVVDIHNRRHPISRQSRGVNALSIGFTSHYDRMRERFGDAVADGVAGENIIVVSDRQWTAEELASGLDVETATGELVRLKRIVVAAPCVEFTRWALRYPEDARPDLRVTEGVRFLDDGLRGFYAAYDGQPVTITLGNRVFVEETRGDHGRPERGAWPFSTT